MPKLIKKITHGFIIQVYDTNKRYWISQEFVEGDQVDWEDGNGEFLDDAEESPAYDDDLPFDMVQPKK